MASAIVYLVTGNVNKLMEAREAIRGSCIRLEQASVDKVEIQSDRLEDIALYAARQAFKMLGKPVVVEDAGLFVDALKGFPGPYSSYVYKTIGVEGLLKLLEGVGNRRACFKSALAYVDGNREEVVVGEACGSIAIEPRGGGGFGFDPVFIPEGSDRTFAEMSVEEKNTYSHRSRAFKLLADKLCRV